MCKLSGFCLVILAECDLECKNGETCKVISFMKTCTCLDNFIGPTCEIGMFQVFLNLSFYIDCD